MCNVRPIIYKLKNHFLTNGRSWLKAALSRQKIFIWLISAACSGASTVCRTRGPTDLADFFSTSNFDLSYFCSLLIYKDAQYLIWKFWFIPLWSLKPKAVVWLLTGSMLGQSTPISYHTEANGCIFFAVGVTPNGYSFFWYWNQWGKFEVPDFEFDLVEMYVL